MAKANHPDNETGRGKLEDAALDRMLDKALAKYAVAEPRAGLEDRILANLRAERSRITDRHWWRWSVVAAVIAVVIAVATLALKSGKPLPLVKNPPPANTPRLNEPEINRPETQLAKHEPDAVPPPSHQLPYRNVARSVQPVAVATPNPKLDQFPSPRPLSEQEKLLARYIAQDPERATLVAEARMEVLRKDHEQQQQETSDDSRDAMSRDTKSR
jgi:hypothetical protein